MTLKRKKPMEEQYEMEQIDQELRAAIIAAVPEIVELKFGCRLETGETYIGRTENDEYYFALDEDVNGDRDIFSIEDLDSLKILGRPITIADVLRAIGGINLSSSVDRNILVLIDESANSCLWNLRNSYEDQSEETKRFLHGVICKK